MATFSAVKPRRMRVSLAGALLASWVSFPAVAVAAENLPAYTIHRVGSPIAVDGRLDEPAWVAAPAVGRFHFPWWKSGKREQTVAKLLYDDRNVYLAYICQDAHIWAEHTARDSAVHRDDCVEFFVAPHSDRPSAYFNLEMNVLGIFLDEFHPAPPETAKREFNAQGVRISTHIAGTLNDDSDEDDYWILEAAVPLKNFALAAPRMPPQPGDVWRVGLNRCGGQTNRQHSQWSPSDTPAPAFHVPQRFGRMQFSGVTSPE